jgi:hypothetical protein
VRSRILLFALLVAVLVVLPATALGGAARVTANSQTFNDSVGEDPNAPDITSVVISNDDAGNIAMKINISNRPALTPDMLVLIFLDADKNPATGDPQSLGADYAIQLQTGAVDLFKWNGTTYTGATSPSLTFAYDATGAAIHISAADLGGTKGFNFAVLAASGIAVDANGNPDFTNEKDDLAPDPGHGFWSYTVIAKLTVTVQAFVYAPKPAKQGKNFAAGFAATESDTNGPVTKGTVACTATAGTKHLVALTHAVTNGVVACVWHVPLATKGKTLRGTVTLTVQGTTVTRSFAVKIT